MPVATIDARKIYYLEAGQGGIPIVFIHGWASSGRSWQRVLNLLPSTCRGYALDLPGHGESDNSDQRYGVEHFASQVFAFTQFLQLERPVIVGHSAGGGVGMRLALDHPGDLRGLALVAPTPAEDMPLSPEDMAYMTEARQDPRILREMLGGGFVTPPSPEALEAMVTDSRKVSDEAYFWPIKAGGWQAGLEGSLAQLQTPTIIIAGDQDPYIPLESLLRMFRTIPTCGFAVIYRASHALPMEKAEGLAKTLVEFIDNLPPR